MSEIVFLPDAVAPVAPSRTDRTLSYTPSVGMIAAVALLLLLVVADIAILHFTVDGLAFFTTIVVCPIFAGVYCRIQNMDARLASASSMLGVFYLLLLLATTLQYTMAAHGARDLVDPILRQIDNALGLDPVAFTRFFDPWPRVCNALLVIYSSINWELAGIVALLYFRRDFARFDSLIITLVLLIIIGTVLAAIFPAIGFTGVEDIHFINTDVGGGRVGQPNFLALRAGVLRRIDFNSAPGIITFPSCHAALAALFVMIVANIPSLFWPLAFINTLMLIGTIVHGGHYFIDIFAGIAITAMTWPLAQKIQSWRPGWKFAPRPRTV